MIFVKRIERVNRFAELRFQITGHDLIHEIPLEGIPCFDRNIGMFLRELFPGIKLGFESVIFHEVDNIPAFLAAHQGAEDIKPFSGYRFRGCYLFHFRD